MLTIWRKSWGKWSLKYKLKYSPDASDKLRKLNKQIAGSNGKLVATRIVSKIMGEIRGLQNNLEKGPSVEALLGIPASYRFLHVGDVSREFENTR